MSLASKTLLLQHQFFLSFKDAQRLIMQVLILAYSKGGAGKRQHCPFSWLVQLLHPPLLCSLPPASAPGSLVRMASCLCQGAWSFSWSDDLGTADDKFNCAQPWREVRKPNWRLLFESLEWEIHSLRGSQHLPFSCTGTEQWSPLDNSWFLSSSPPTLQSFPKMLWS